MLTYKDTEDFIKEIEAQHTDWQTLPPLTYYRKYTTFQVSTLNQLIKIFSSEVSE